MALPPVSQLPPEFFMALGGGILSGDGFGDGMGRGLANATTVLASEREKAEQAQKEGATYNALMKIDPQKAELFKSGVLSPTQAFQMFTAEKKAREDAARPSYKWINQDGKLIRYDENSPTGTPEVMGDFSEPKEPKLPAIAEEYNWAKENGFNGTPQEYQTWKANLSKQKGMTVSYDPVNGFQMTQGDVDKAPPKLTEAQSKDINFLGRAKKAEEQLAPLETELTSWAQKRMTGLPFDTGNYLQTPEYRQAQQAGREVLAIILRKDTGAAITKQEEDIYGKIYLPQPGDDAPTIEAKRKSREAAIRGIQQGLGPVAPDDAGEIPGGNTEAIPAEDYFKSP